MSSRIHGDNVGTIRKDVCALCGKPVESGGGILQEINGFAYTFDKEECALTLKKLKSVYGADFCVILKEE
jgi:hypothetical protein